MPRGNGLGPAGQGPMTGRGAGYCAGSALPGFANAQWACGPGRGLGRGYRRGFGPAAFAWNPPGPAYPPEAERSELALQAETLKRALARVEARLGELGGSDEKQGN